MRTMAGVGLVIALLVAPTARAADDHANWPQLTSTFPSTGGGGMIIKGYDPVVTGQRCITTFMAVEPGDSPAVYPNIIEFEAIPIDGGILCRNGRWRAFDGSASGTTPFRLFLKDGIWRGR
jgi:hypothetical protein